MYASFFSCCDSSLWLRIWRSLPLISLPWRSCKHGHQARRLLRWRTAWNWPRRQTSPSLVAYQFPPLHYHLARKILTLTPYSLPAFIEWLGGGTFFFNKNPLLSWPRCRITRVCLPPALFWDMMSTCPTSSFPALCDSFQRHLRSRSDYVYSVVFCSKM